VVRPYYCLPLFCSFSILPSPLNYFPFSVLFPLSFRLSRWQEAAPGWQPLFGSLLQCLPASFFRRQIVWFLRTGILGFYFLSIFSSSLFCEILCPPLFMLDFLRIRNSRPLIPSLLSLFLRAAAAADSCEQAFFFFVDVPDNLPYCVLCFRQDACPIPPL